MKIIPSIPVSTAVAALVIASALVVTGGCASVPPPVEQMAVADAAVQHANNASTVENAAGELQLAKDKLASAHQAMTAKDYVRARQLAEQVEVDAQVAELHAQSASSRKAASESRDAARVLGEEINRKSVR